MTRLEFNSYITGGVSDLAIGISTASQLPGRQNGGPADVIRHLVLSAELTRRFGRVTAERLLAAHEAEDPDPLGPDSRHDQYINSIGIQLGEFVANQNGSTTDVLSLCYKAMQNSFGQFKYYDTITVGTSLGMSAESDFWIPPVGDMVLNLNGSSLSLRPLALRPYTQWTANPRDPVTDQEIKDPSAPSTRNHKSLRRRPLTRRWWTFDLVHTNGSAVSL